MKIRYGIIGLLILACAVAQATSESTPKSVPYSSELLASLKTACHDPDQIAAEQFKQLVRLGSNLISGKATLSLPNECKTVADSNPYTVALQVASTQKNHNELAQVLENLIPDQQTIEQKAILDSALLRYIKVACGKQLSCVTNTIHTMPKLKFAESPIFCAFTRFADYSVQVYFQNQDKPIYPVACLGHSSLTKGMGLSPMQDWYEAYKLLGE